MLSTVPWGNMATGSIWFARVHVADTNRNSRQCLIVVSRKYDGPRPANFHGFWMWFTTQAIASRLSTPIFRRMLPT